MRRGEVWFAATPAGGRPGLVLSRDHVVHHPVISDAAPLRRIGSELLQRSSHPFAGRRRELPVGLGIRRRELDAVSLSFFTPNSATAGSLPLVTT
jgi:hypothetical protein